MHMHARHAENADHNKCTNSKQNFSTDFLILFCFTFHVAKKSEISQMC